MWVFMFGASLFIAIETVGSIAVLNTSSSAGAPLPKIIPESVECLLYVCVFCLFWHVCCTELAIHVVSRERVVQLPCYHL